MVWPCSKNGRRETAQNSIEVDAETKESTRKTEENWVEGIKKAMNERNLSEGQWENRKQWSLGVGQRRKTFWTRCTYVHTYMGRVVLSYAGFEFLPRRTCDLLFFLILSQLRLPRHLFFPSFSFCACYLFCPLHSRNLISLQCSVHSKLNWAVLLCDIIPDGKT